MAAFCITAGACFASVTVTLKEAGTGNAAVSVAAGSPVLVDVFVAESGEGSGITGVQLTLDAVGPSAGAISLTGPADSAGMSAAINGPEWENDLSSLALPMVTGALPKGPFGSGYAAAATLSGGVTAESKLATIQLSVSGSAPNGVYEVTASGLAFPDYVSSVADLVITSGPAFVVNVGIVPPTATIVGRSLVYNGSTCGIATEKTALLATGGTLTATFANVSAYSRGINGIYVDVANRAAATPAVTDFEVRAGTTGSSAGWGFAAAPTVALLAGAGTGGSDRIQLTWPNNAIPNPTWLRVHVKSNASGGTLGLAADDVFYFGSLIGDTGSSGASASVTSADYNSGYAGRNTAVACTDPRDFDKNKVITSSDYNLAYANRNKVLSYTVQP